MLPQHLSKTGIDVNLPDSVAGLGGVFPAHSRRHGERRSTQLSRSRSSTCRPDASPIRMPVPASNANRTRYWPSAPSMICSQLFFCEIPLLWIIGLTQVQFPRHPNLLPRTSFTTPTILRIVLRLSLYVLMRSPFGFLISNVALFRSATNSWTTVSSTASKGKEPNRGKDVFSEIGFPCSARNSVFRPSKPCDTCGTIRRVARR